MLLVVDVVGLCGFTAGAFAHVQPTGFTQELSMPRSKETPKQPIGFTAPLVETAPAQPVAKPRAKPRAKQAAKQAAKKTAKKAAPKRAPTRAPRAAAPAPDTIDTIKQLAEALKPSGSHNRWVGVRNISSDVIGVPNPVAGQPDLLALHADLPDPADPTKFLPNPNAVTAVPHSVWMQLRRGSLYERGMIVRDDSVLGSTYEPAEPDRPNDLAPGWAKNAVPDPTAFIERSEDELRAAIDQMTSEQSLKRLLAAYNQRIEKERQRLQSNGDEVKEARALRSVPAIYQLCEELVLARLEALGYR